MVEELYEKYHLELVRWCQGMTGNLQTAEELVQEAFLRAMLNEKQLSMLSEKQGRAWLFRTVKNMYIDYLRHMSRETIVDELPKNLKASETMLAVEWEELLDLLPDMEGMLFKMRYIEGYNSKQIGEMLQIPPGTVRSKLFSARKHLKNAIGGKENV